MQFEAFRIILLPASGCEQPVISTSAKLPSRLVITFSILEKLSQLDIYG